MMKKGIFILALLVSSAGIAQSGFGIKGGLNYGSHGDITYSEVMDAGEDVMAGADSKNGYHFGVFYETKSLLGFYLRPELVYTNTKSDYEFNSQTSEYSISKIDLPLLVGTGLIGPLDVFAGPSLEYILDNDLEGVNLGDVEREFTIGAQLGVGVEIGNFGIDVRYERGLKENEAEALNLDNSEGVRRVDSRPSQIIFSVSMGL